MDIKAKVQEIVEKVKGDKSFAKKFKSNPLQAVKSVLGVNIPDDQIKAVIDGVKAKLSLEKADGVLGRIKNLFKK